MPSFAPFPLSFQDQIAEAVRVAADRQAERVQRIETPSGQVWLKRIEQLSLRWRLQKGDPVRRFCKDRDGLHLLHDAGLPVAPIVAEGPDYYATPHLGPTLSALTRETAAGTAARAVVFAAGGRSLGLLHRSGYSHGRPALRDMCWTGQDVIFIDMECFSPRHRRARHRALDVMIFVHSALADGADDADVDVALAAYRREAGDADLRRAGALARRLGWLGPLSGWVQARRPKAREIAAVRPTLRYLRRLT